MKIALLTVVSGDCADTWERFVQRADRYFMPRSERHFFVLSDTDRLSAPVPNATFFKVSRREFAEIHLRRHQWCVSIKDCLKAGFDYVYFLPVFAEFQREIDSDFLPARSEQLVAVQHPRFVNIPANRLPLERDGRSRAFVPVGEGTQYVTSEIYGGTVSTFLKLSQWINESIATDTTNGVSACRQLESHLNRYVIDHPVAVRHAGYSYPECWDLGVPKVIQMASGGISEQRRAWPGYRPVGLKESVSIEIGGDLGLQLTQYAVGRCIAERKGSRLFLDTRSLHENGNQFFALGHFKINAEIARQESRLSLTGRKLRRMVEQFWPGRGLTQIQLGDGSIDVGAFNPPGSLHLACHQHCVTGIDHIREELMEELSVSTDLGWPAKKLLSEIESVWAVAVHIPRNEGYFSKWHPDSTGSLPATYYQRAIDYLCSQLPVPPVFYFFTDDVEWVKSSLNCPGRHQFVDLQEPSKAHEDLRLMQACRSKIISQASISWWAAWLSDGQNHSVVAPALSSDSQASSDVKSIADSWMWIDYQNLSCQNKGVQVTKHAA